MAAKHKRSITVTDRDIELEDNEKGVSGSKKYLSGVYDDGLSYLNLTSAFFCSVDVICTW